MPSQLDVVQNRHALKQFNVLKRSRNSQFGHVMLGNASDVTALEQDLAFLKNVKSTDAVQQAGFANNDIHIVIKS